jgi:hypothetical protein
MNFNPVHIALLDESTFNQVLSVAALGLGKLQKDPSSTELEVRPQGYMTSASTLTPS